METISKLRQRFLAEVFKPGAFAREQTPLERQLNVQARVVAHLKTWGGIDARTAQNLGTTDARKMFTRLREKGLLHPANDPRGFVSLPNASGQGTYRWHRWTGKNEKVGA
jgi:hypothetical protein